VRVGGGFLTIDDFLEQYYDVETEKINKTSKDLFIFKMKLLKILCKISIKDPH